MENSLQQEKEDIFVSRAELIKHLKDYKEENSRLREENRILKTVYKDCMRI